MTSVVESQKKYRVNFASTSTKSDRLLAHLIHFNVEQLAELFNFSADIPDRAVMRRPALGPVVHKLLRADTEFTATVSVTDL